MKEYHYGQTHLNDVNRILRDWASQGWEVQWCNRNHNTSIVDFLFVREAK